MRATEKKENTMKSLYILQHQIDGEWVDWDVVEWTYAELVERVNLAKRLGRTVRAFNQNDVQVL